MNNFQDVIHCPQCHSVLVILPDEDKYNQTTPLFCEECRQYYTVRVEIVPK